MTITLTDAAKKQLREMFVGADPKPIGIRFAVIGGGCSGFSYHMAWWNPDNTLAQHLQGRDHAYDLDGNELDYATKARVVPNVPEELKMFVDDMSAMYLTGTTVDYQETLQGSGFVFNNPNVKSQCGCGSSFSV